MAHLNVSVDFNSDSETLTGNGWRVVHWLDSGEGTPQTQTETFYATVTLALAAVEELFSSDEEIDMYFHDKAVEDLVTTSAPSITSSKSALRTAEGLDATMA